jgi:hypothetical protein
MNMKQKKVDLFSSVNPEGKRVFELQDHTESNQIPKWSVELNETEFCELVEMLYVEYCRIRKSMSVTGDRILPVGRRGDRYYISVNTYWELTHCKVTPNEEEFKSLRLLVTLRGEKSNLVILRQFCIKADEHGHASLISDMLQEKE